MRLNRACGLASAVLAAAAHSAAAQFIGTNVPGSTKTLAGGLIPPHTNGAIGQDHYVEFVKGRWATYRKSDGALVSAASGTSRTFWTSAGLTIPAADTISYPRIVYDHASSRWFASSIDVVGGVTTNTNNIFLGVSNSSDPTAGWKAFKIDPNGSFVDLVSLGLDSSGVYLAGNNYAITGANGFQDTVAVVSIPKSDLLLPIPTVANRTTFAAESAIDRGWGLQPAVNMGVSSSGGFLMGPDLEFFGLLDRTGVTNAGGPGAASLQSTVYISVADDAPPPLARQPNGTRNLQTFVDTASVVRVGDIIWTASGATASGAAAVRWHKIDALTNAILGTGLIGDAGHDLGFPSISANSNGDVVIGFTRSGPAAGEFASSYAVVGTTTGGVTTFASPFQLKAGSANYQVLSGSDNRWGSYSSTTLDPCDPQVFWTIQAFAAGSTEWQTQISEVIVPKANEFRWKTAANGTFSTAANWFSGVSPVGNSTARVIFSRATDPAGAGYTVTLGAAVTNDSLAVRQGMVTLSLGANYSLTNTSTTTPSVIVGEFAGNSKLTLNGGGQLNSVAAAIAPSTAATATVELNNATWSSTNSIVVGGSLAAAGGSGSLSVGTGANVITPELKAWSTGTISLAGGAINAGLVRLAGGRLVSGTNTSLASPVNSQAGIIQVDSGTLTLTGALTIAAGSTLSKTGAATLTIAGPQAHGASATLTTSAGVTNIDTNAAGLAINANSTTNFNAAQQLASLNVGSGATATLFDGASIRAIKANAVTINNGKLDLKRNALITDTPVGVATNGVYTGVQRMVQLGRNSGGWNAPGLTTSIPDAAAGYTTLGVATGAEVMGLGAAQTAVYAGQTITGASTVVLYTYAGDANLSGSVDADDYFMIDSNYSRRSQAGFVVSYSKGDFNFDGAITGDDFAMIDSGFRAQFGGGVAITVSAVPEPACFSAIGLLITAVAARRSRQNPFQPTG